MRVNVSSLCAPPNEEPRVGNVYPVRGGHGMRNKSMFVLFHINRAKGLGLLVTIDKDGEPVGVTQYGMHYIEELSPIAFVDGLEDLEFNMRSI